MQLVAGLGRSTRKVSGDSLGLSVVAVAGVLAVLVIGCLETSDAAGLSKSSRHRNWYLEHIADQHVSAGVGT